CYAKEGSMVNQGEQVGFIKFGSRIDLFLPIESRIQVTRGQKVKGTQTIIARLPEPGVNEPRREEDVPESEISIVEV
ncbi:MAG: phosphatidylserine decarboxylase, partial [Bacteroidales bacterium]|nr:phosphatidylserine decarboxylase [Bacteroidales bacterium]